MYHVGIDYHKKYSVVTAINDDGERVLEGRIAPNTLEHFEAFFEQLGGPCRIVYEAGLNWGYLYDILSEVPQIDEIIMAHAYHVRLIAEARIKTDKIDARKLAMLLRGGFIPEVYIPGKETRSRKLVVRQRAGHVRQRTKTRNRIHRILERQRDLKLPKVKNLFGVKGLAALHRLDLPDPVDQQLLTQDLERFDLISRQIKDLEKDIREEGRQDERLTYLESIPGIGVVIGSIIALEIDDVHRFRSARKFCAYAGLVPGTYSSGGKTSHGHMLKSCNKWLKWAFIEAAWVAINNDAYLGDLYKRQRARGKKANIAITIVAHRMAEIVYSLLKEERPYERIIKSTPLSPGRPDNALVVAPC
jgi:transposase